MMRTEFHATKKPAQLDIEGDLSFAHVSDLHAALLTACDAVDELVVSLDKVTSIDAAGLQLLFAVCRYADKSKKLVQIVPGAASERIDRILEFSGLTSPNCLAGDIAQ
ncbi:MAG: anti-sigma factor antagonist [Spirochaetaceae bacterium]|nr:MAG: anti-sigma factor antagonist [Spirochaetaceae bacterium]